jgi:hypothetical protein
LEGFEGWKVLKVGKVEWLGRFEGEVIQPERDIQKYGVFTIELKIIIFRKTTVSLQKAYCKPLKAYSRLIVGFL